jgi:nucleotide-binding universal stress UspA family protein
MSWMKREKLPNAPYDAGEKRILFPFDAHGLAPSALDAALRLARSQGGTLVPVFLARVPRQLPMDAALSRQSQLAVPMQDAVEERAAEYDVPVDSRIERGRSYRHALRLTIQNERFDMIVLAAAVGQGPGFNASDVAWLLANAPGEIVVLRPAPTLVAAGG